MLFNCQIFVCLCYCKPKMSDSGEEDYFAHLGLESMFDDEVEERQAQSENGEDHHHHLYTTLHLYHFTPTTTLIGSLQTFTITPFPYVFGKTYIRFTIFHVCIYYTPILCF